MASRMVAIARSTHPVPTVGVTVIAIVLAATAGLDAARVALVGATILANQLSIGLSNDSIDAERDRATGRTDKPVATGEVSPRVALALAVVAAVASLALGFALHPLAGLANAAFVASGWAYNAGLKRTVVSVLPYATGFGAFPAVVSFAAMPPVAPSPWIVAAGALLGVGAHFANALPDLDDDRAAGIRGTPHLAGARLSAVLMAASLAGASACLLVVVRLPVALTVAAAVVSGGLAVACGAVALARPASRAVFVLTIGAGLLAAVLLAISGSALDGGAR